MSELLDIVDEDDKVVGSEERDICHRKKLTHRSVMFFIFDGKGRILVTKRSKDKDFFPGRYSIVLGGHVSKGQSYGQAASREAYEEAKVASEPFEMGFFKKRLNEENENVKVFGFKTDGKVSLLEDEIESGTFMGVKEAEKLMGDEEFLPETGQLLKILIQYLDEG